jgi:hypothetical protein
MEGENKHAYDVRAALHGIFPDNGRIPANARTAPEAGETAFCFRESKSRLANGGVR